MLIKGHVTSFRGGEEGLRRDAPHVHARSTDRAVFNHDDGRTLSSGLDSGGERRTTRTHDGQVKVTLFGH